MNAVIGRRMRRDIVTKKEIVMLAKAKEEGSRGALEASYDLVKAEVTLRLPRRVFSLGETIEGVVLVKPSKSFRVDELKVDALHYAEMIPEAILKQPILSFTDFRGSDVYCLSSHNT